MPAYTYKGLDGRGKPVSGASDADSPRSLRASLRKEGIFVTDVCETSEQAPGASSGLSREVDLKGIFDRVRPQEISMITRQMGTLLRAGIPLVETLQALLDQTSSPKLKRVLAKVRTSVNEGIALGDALAEHPKYFPDLYVNMVRAGETAGNLEQVVLRLAEFMDNQVRLKSKVASAMLYPAIMGAVGILITALLMIVVVPKVTRIFADVDKALPWYTQSLVAVSGIAASYWWLIALLGVVAWQGFVRWKRTSAGKLRWDRFVLRIWVVGALVRKVAIARFARTLGTMLASGVPVLQALEIVKAILGNQVLVDVVDEARSAIREGDSIAAPLERSGHFPPVVTRMIAVGERSGQLEGMLETVAAAYETEVDISLERLTTLLEPIMILMLGGVVFFIVMSILMPILQMNEMIG